MNKKFYYLHMIEGGEGGTAYSPNDNDIDFVEELQNLKETPFEFILRDGVAQDYFNNDLAWPIFSGKFKALIDQFLAQDSFQWVKTVINKPDNKRYVAFILKSNKEQDVLDKDKTIYATDDVVVKSVLSQEKVKDLDLFFVPGSGFRIIVSEDIKSKIETQNLTGMAFSNVPIA